MKEFVRSVVSAVQWNYWPRGNVIGHWRSVTFHTSWLISFNGMSLRCATNVRNSTLNVNFAAVGVFLACFAAGRSFVRTFMRRSHYHTPQYLEREVLSALHTETAC